jgi:hypothetical protein
MVPLYPDDAKWDELGIAYEGKMGVGGVMEYPDMVLDYSEIKDLVNTLPPSAQYDDFDSGIVGDGGDISQADDATTTTPPTDIPVRGILIVILAIAAVVVTTWMVRRKSQKNH